MVGDVPPTVEVLCIANGEVVMFAGHVRPAGEGLRVPADVGTDVCLFSLTVHPVGDRDLESPLDGFVELDMPEDVLSRIGSTSAGMYSCKAGSTTNSRRSDSLG